MVTLVLHTEKLKPVNIKYFAEYTAVKFIPRLEPKAAFTMRWIVLSAA